MLFGFIRKEKYIQFSVFGIITSILGFLAAILLIWEFVDLEGNLGLTGWGELLLTLIILTTSTAHSCLLFLIKSKKSFVKNTLFATIGFISIVAVMLIFLVLEIIDEPGEYYFRLIGVFAILDVLGTIVTPILHKVYSTKH